ncbi:SMI1/KNR4 family protein [Nocardia africana]|uniref:SMI1/KNR4 family protein n=1 Tax=Nocardia africana TaxID=134964 RepID=UPI000AB91AE1|nr:SMI1/KNR4 family protein [Nocardia africana]MCC3318094.1 SMI1/KNR4 family protein [Nocardia africana]
MASDASRQDIESFGRELLESGFATRESIIGCNAEEIAQVYAVAPVGFPVPGEYHAFLEHMGKKAGTLFRGTDLFFPQMLDSRDAAVDISGEGLSLDDRFFFGDHQGYKVYFFKLGSEAVYTYQEGDPEETKLADGFIAFLRQSWNVQRKLRESTTAMRNQSERP